MSNLQELRKTGIELGLMIRNIAEAMRALADGFHAGATMTREMSLESRELISKRRLQTHIANERNEGARYVRREADRVRRELGLTR